VLGLDPKAQPRWVPASRLSSVAACGLLYRPDANIIDHARERLRIGPERYSLCGVTHTLASHAPAEAVVDLVGEPVMPWDAVICTSTAARVFVEGRLSEQEDYLAWRFGQKLTIPRPQLPVIPLGVHCEDFACSDGDRAAARARLGLEWDEVAVLFAGRLTFNAKVHPFQMYVAMEQAAKATDRRLTLVHAGRFANTAIEEVYKTAVAKWCPSVQVLFLDGGDFPLYAGAWRAADIFVSLSDNIQETFGITPLEAMACGMPVLVSDWNGYKDTVRDGIDGFRIPTWAPGPGSGAEMALDFETFTHNYDYFLSRTSTTTSVEAGALLERLTALIETPELRRRMGEAGRARARSEFDWSVIYRRYEALWGELGRIRARGAADPALRLNAAPKASPVRPDPFTAFAHYPTHHVGAATRVRAAKGADGEAYAALVVHPMHRTWSSPPELIGRTLAACGGQTTVGRLAAALGEPLPAVLERVARLAKMELVILEPGEAED
jgi:glycosyltransferase involved in cell wall biosynthesis